MGAFVVVVIVIVVAAILFGRANKSQEQKQYVPETQVSRDTAYGMTWPKPSKDNLWDTLDFFVRLAEVQSEWTSFDTTSVGLILYVEDKYDHRKGDFEINYFDFDGAKMYAKEIPYLSTKLMEIDGRFKGYDPSSTIFKISVEEVYEMIQREAPHVQFGKVIKGWGDGTLCMRFLFPPRRG